MTIQQMHVWFRQYAQQMGMQNVRAILPEQIDILLNTSITDTINRIVQENISLTNDRVITDNSKLGQINAFRTLYKTYSLELNEDNLHLIKLIDYKTPIAKFEIDLVDKGKPLFEYMFIDDFSLGYIKMAPNSGWALRDKTITLEGNYDKVNGGYQTLPFPVRIIENRYLADTLNDFILRPSLRSPIMVVYKGDNTVTLGLYIDKFTYTTVNQLNVFTLNHNLLPYKLYINYIAKPAKVSYVDDLTGNETNNQDCDLPEYMHVDVVKHAVDLYRITISGAMQGAQAQQQQAQQEAVRNNYRNDGNRQ